jgi:hypothetical protein
VIAGGVKAVLDFLETVEEKRIIGHSLFDELFE